LAASRVQSPAEAAARTAAPSPSPILVPVEKRVLSANVVTRGKARFGLPQPISIAPSFLKPQSGLITTLPVRNKQLAEGDVMLTASGRPVFVLRGELPAYRDLVPGLEGNDVRQLEAGLQRLGFRPGPVDGVYDAATGRAVAAWYRAKGFEAFGPTKDQEAQQRALERELELATTVQVGADNAAAAAALSVESARATAEHNRRVASAELAAQTAARAAIVLDPQQTESARAAADARLEQAEAGVAAARLAGDMVIQGALDARKVAELEAGSAAARVDELTAQLSALERRLGIQVPADEIVFIPSPPVRVESVDVVVGDAARGPIMSVTDNDVAVDSSLPLDAAALVHPGMRVAIDEPALGVEARGTVRMVASTPGSYGVGGHRIYFEVRVDPTPTPLDGFSLRLTIPIESTQGAVTAVPISALSLAANGTSRVQVENNGILEYVVVEPGLSADGFVEVNPVAGELAPGQLVVIGYESPGSVGLP
jgi:peptidoglycan hydrolase-like protein with peptidoglycan-binding domain